MRFQLLAGSLSLIKLVCAAVHPPESHLNSQSSAQGLEIIEDGQSVTNRIFSGEIHSYVYIPQPSNESFPLMYTTGNLALQPPIDTTSNNTDLQVCLSWLKPSLNVLETTEQAFNCSSFSLGYYGNLIVANSTDTMYISLIAPSIANSSVPWTYTLELSSQFAAFNWASRPFVDVLDTDFNSALLVTGPMAGKLLNSTSETFSNLTYTYDLYLYPVNYTGLENLERSWQAVANGPALYSTKNKPIVMTNRGGGLHQQFYITGLNSSTEYAGYLTAAGTEFGARTIVYAKFIFETMDSQACKIIYDLDFCEGVAYSVPVSSHINYNNTAALKQIYDSKVATLYSNFSKSLQQVACNASDENRYSPINNCTNCVKQYKTWLCAVTIPRCSTYFEPGYSYREHGESRNEFVNEVIEPPLPYYEVMPCIDLCNEMVRDCPAQLKLACPTSSAAIEQSYGVFELNLTYDTCNLISEAYFLLTWGLLDRGGNT